MALSRADKERVIKIGIRMIKKEEPEATSLYAVNCMLAIALNDDDQEMIEDLKNYQRKYFN